MTEVNPFHDYPVVRLHDDAAEVSGSTIITPSIQQSRDSVKEYIEQWERRASAPSSPTDSLAVGVRGDYGTGKTHLLLDAAAQVTTRLSTPFPDVTVIRVACLDTDPVDWFRQGFGPALKRPFLKNTVVKLLSFAGIDVAAAADLTRAAADRLRQDPKLIRRFLRESILNDTAVEERFNALLREVCPEDVSEAVRFALAGLASEQTEDAATRWLAGEKITDREASMLHLSATRLSSESDAQSVLVAVAALQSYVGNPFGVMIDELEHLTRRDRPGGGTPTLTWLKRVLEGLAGNRALIYVSGHESAWGAYNDFGDRFSRYRPITLRRWTADDVMKLVNTRKPDRPEGNFELAQAEVVAALTKGNVRRVVSMCRALFRESGGFSKAVTAEDIGRVAEWIGQSVSIDEATERVREIMEGAGLRTETRGILNADGATPKKVRFDLVGYEGDRPRVVAELKHAVDQRFMSAAARRFVAQMGEVAGAYPDLLGCFICDGNVDDDVLAALAAEPKLRIVTFDLTQHDTLMTIERELSARLSDGREIGPEATRLKELQDRDESIKERIEVARRDDDQELVGRLQEERGALKTEVSDLRSQLGESSRRLEQELAAIEEKRKGELDALYERLDQLSRQATSQRDAEIVGPQQEEVTARLQTTYADLTKPLLLSTRFRLALSNRVAGIGIGSIILGIILYLISGGVADYLFPDYQEYRYDQQRHTSLKYSLLFLGLGLLIFGLYIVWRRFMQTEAYLAYTTRLLREVYLQSPDPKELVKVNNILSDCLEDRGPVWGKRRANGILAKEFPEYFSYLVDRKADEGESKADEGGPKVDVIER